MELYGGLPGAKVHFSSFDKWLQKSFQRHPGEHFHLGKGHFGGSIKPYFSRSVGGEAPAAILGASASSQLPLQLLFQLQFQLHPSALTSASTAILAYTLTSNHEVQPLTLNIRFLHP